MRLSDKSEESVQFYAITSEGFRRIIITDQFIGPEATALEKFIPSVPIVVFNAYPGMALAMNSLFVSLAQRIYEIELNTFYRPFEDTENSATMVPVFAKSKTSSELKFTWHTPQDMKLSLVCSWSIKRSFIDLNATTVYLVACNPSGITFLLPLPNLYDDGKVCLGSSDIIVGESIFDRFESAKGIFKKTAWNTDLLSSDSIMRSRQMFRFSPKGTQMAPLRPWQDLCKKINHYAYEWIAKMP